MAKIGKGKKEKVLFFCTDCGREEPQWSGKCPACGSWDTMKEAPAAFTKVTGRTSASIESQKAVAITDVATEEAQRFSSGSAEFDRVLGGGLVVGGVTLIGGEPGVGKSTILLQVANFIASTGSTVLYASGEENQRQIRLRAERIGCCRDNLLVMGSTSVDAIFAEVERLNPVLLIVDSIQTMEDSATESVAGSVSQIRNATSKLVAMAKEKGLATFVVGHVTKDGEIAGPKMLEHMVDTVLAFEGDSDRVYRFLRTVKNRFGPMSEVGVFCMERTGLEDVPNPSSLFIHRASLEHSGACLAPVIVGTRCYVVEVQALVTENHFTFGRRIAQGYDLNRLNLILSVIEKRLSLSMGNYDVCINVTGGLKIKEPALDLAVAVAILSSYYDETVSSGASWCGELGLSGEIRPVHHLEQRLEEVVRVGCSSLYMPPAKKALSKEKTAKCTIHALSDLQGAERIVRHDT